MVDYDLQTSSAIKVEELSYQETVAVIVDLHQHIVDFWGNAEGWAPFKSANLLSKSRLDWLLSLSKALYLWTGYQEETNNPGYLILAWANLGSLLEGTMKLFLSVYYEDYAKDKFKKRGKGVNPDKVELDNLREYFSKHIWQDEKKKKERNKWIQSIEQKRNAIHAFKDRDIGNFKIFYAEVHRYLKYLLEMIDRLPYPENHNV